MCPCLSLLLLLLPPNAPTMRSLRPYNRPAECLAIRRFFIRVLFFDALRSALLSFSTAWVREGDLFEVFTSVHSKSQKRGKEKRKIIKRATCQTFAASKVVSFFFSKGKKGSQWRVILPLDLFPFRTWSWWKFYFRLLNKVCVSLIHIWCRHHLFLFFTKTSNPVTPLCDPASDLSGTLVSTTLFWRCEQTKDFFCAQKSSHKTLCPFILLCLRFFVIFPSGNKASDFVVTSLYIT